MIKIVAIVIIMLCCYQIGYNQSLKLMKQVKLLREIEKMFVYIKNNISYVAKPLKEIFYELAHSKEFKELDFIETCNDNLKNGEKFELAFVSGVQKSELPLRQEDKELLISFGSQLGSSDIDGEMNKLAFYQDKLKILQKEATEKRDKLAKLYTSLGIFAGLALALVLL